MTSMKRRSGIEFDGVEDEGLLVGPGDVAQVHVAVAFADETTGLAGGEVASQAFALGPAPGFDAVDDGRGDPPASAGRADG
ncbi:MAG: hypothetical protein IPN00_11790 [Hydrogenophilales bacterium]|nr:hypothetical protein [Hydrogenophilales bacterium]